jgi:hypothetical protein
VTGDGAGDRFDLVAHFRRPRTGQDLDIVRPAGETFPIAAYARWSSADADLAVLNDMLEVLTLFEVDALTDAILERLPFELPELREFAQRPSWTITTGDDRCRILRPVDGLAGVVERDDFLVTLEVLIRTALEPFDDTTDRPEWANRAQGVHTRLVAALGDSELFEPAA